MYKIKYIVNKLKEYLSDNGIIFWIGEKAIYVVDFIEEINGIYISYRNTWYKKDLFGNSDTSELYIDYDFNYMFREIASDEDLIDFIKDIRELDIDICIDEGLVITREDSEKWGRLYKHYLFLKSIGSIGKKAGGIKISTSENPKYYTPHEKEVLIKLINSSYKCNYIIISN